jgi:hypothetical protein
MTRLAQWLRPIFPRKAVVTLTIPGLDSASCTLFEYRLNSALSECGCRLSALLLMVGVCAAIGIDIWFWPTVRESLGTWLAAESGAVFLVSAAGKAIGIANARRKLRCELRTIHDRMNARTDQR